MPDNREQILDRFSRQADRFDRMGRSVARKDYVQWAASLIESRPDAVALDVAGGTGLMARAVAPRVKQVVILDYTPAMLAQARAGAAADGIVNLSLLRGDAKRLPFADASLDIVMTRFALHHIPDPQDVAREMKRVARPGGQVAVTDLISEDDAAAALEHNRLERLRDPSHVRALNAKELEALLTSTGLTVVRRDLRQLEIEVDEWLALTQPPPEVSREIRQALERELEGGSPTGMQPVRRDSLMFTQTALALLAKR